MSRYIAGRIQQNQPHGVLPVLFVFCTGKQFEVDIFIVIIFYWLLRYIETVYLIGDFCGQDICGGNPYRNLLYLSSKLVVPVFATNNLFLNKTIFFWNPFYVYLFNLRSQFPFGNCYLWVATVGFVLLGVLVDSGIRRNILFYYFVEVDIY